MEIAIVISLLSLIVVILYYLKPLLIHRLKTRKVKVTVINENGEKNVDILYLYPDDPLWEVIKAHKGEYHA